LPLLKFQPSYNIYYASGAVYLYHLTFSEPFSSLQSLTMKWTTGV